jgi:hypothetical protein
MKSIFAIGIILVLLALFFLIYFDQLVHPTITYAPVLPGISSFRGPVASPPEGAASPATTFSPPAFTGPRASPKIIGPKGPPPG